MKADCHMPLLVFLAGALEASASAASSHPGISLQQEWMFKGLAVLGVFLALLGLWASWLLLRLLRAGRSTRAPGAADSMPSAGTGGERVAAGESGIRPGAGAEVNSARVRERLVCLVARHDKVIQSPIAGVYITLGKCLQDLGFSVQRATGLSELEGLLEEGVPGVMGVDCRLGPRTLREIARLARAHPAMRDCVFLFYNAERPESIHPPAILPHAHFLGLAFASQQVMEILAPAFEFEPAPEESGSVDTGAIFEGVLSENSLPEILQFLEIGRRTGLLSLETEQPAGVINFQDGDITSAQTHLHEGVEAVFEMLALNRGKFRFFPGKVTATGGARISATQVLMHWAQRVDETGEMAVRPEGGTLLDTLG
jgi:hypothetical protein